MFITITEGTPSSAWKTFLPTVNPLKVKPGRSVIIIGMDSARALEAEDEIRSRHTAGRVKRRIQDMKLPLEIPAGGEKEIRRSPEGFAEECSERGKAGQLQGEEESAARPAENQKAINLHRRAPLFSR